MIDINEVFLKLASIWVVLGDELGECEFLGEFDFEGDDVDGGGVRRTLKGEKHDEEVIMKWTNCNFIQRVVNERSGVTTEEDWEDEEDEEEVWEVEEEEEVWELDFLDLKNFDNVDIDDGEWWVGEECDAFWSKEGLILGEEFMDTVWSGADEVIEINKRSKGTYEILEAKYRFKI